MAFDFSRLRDDQLYRLQEVGGDLSQLTDNELLELQASQEDVSDFQAGRMAAGAALETGIAGLLSAFGFEDTAESTMESAEQTQEEISRRYQRDVPSIVESFETQGVMGGISDLPEFLKETLAFSLPQTGAALAAGAAGTLVGGPLTGLATATAVGTPIFAGYNIQRQMEEQGIGFEDAQVAKAYGVGVGQAALDAIIGRLLGVYGRSTPTTEAAKKKVAEEVAKAAKRGLTNRVLRKGAAGFGQEAVTETLQQSLEIVQANPEKLFDFGPEVRAELLESAIAGGLLGGAISAPTGIIRPTVPTDPLKEKEQDLDRHMQEEAAEAAEMQRNADFLAGKPIEPQPFPPKDRLQQVMEDFPPFSPLPEREPVVEALEGDYIPAVQEGIELLELPPTAIDPLFAEIRRPEGEGPAMPVLPRGTGVITAEGPTVDVEGQPPGIGGTLAITREGEVAPEGRRSPIEITPEGAVTQPSIDLGINPFGDTKVLNLINKISSDEKAQLDTAPLGKVQMNLSTDKFKVYKRRDPATNAFIYSVTDGQNVIELNRDPFPPAAGMNYTQDILNSSRSDSISTIPASNLKEAVQNAIDTWGTAQFKPTTGTTPRQKSRARTELRKRLGELGLGKERTERIVSASSEGLGAASRLSKKASDTAAAQAREGAKEFATKTQQREYRNLTKKVKDVLVKRLKDLGLNDVALKFERVINPEEGIIAEGYATPLEQTEVRDQDQAGRVLIALSSQIYKADITEAELTKRLGEVMNHEMIHAIKMLGLFTPQEYTTLVKAAKAQAFVDKKGETRKFTYFERAQRLYGDQSAEIQEEEAVAELFRDWAAGRKKLGGKPVSLFRRIVNFLKGIAEDADAEGIFKKIETGEVGARERGPMAEEQGEMFSRRGPAEFNSFSREGQEELDRVLSKTRKIPAGEFDIPVPEQAEDQGYSEQKFVHVGPEGISSYDFDAERVNAGLSPEGIYTSRSADKINLYADRLREKGITPFEYELTTTARNTFVLNKDKPNKAMMDAYRKQLERRFAGDAGYIEGKLSEFERTAIPPTDMSRKERSDIYRAGGAEILLDGEDFVFLNPEQVRDVAADFDPSKQGQSGIFYSRKPVSAANPFGVDMNRTVLPVYPERYIDERKVKNKKQEVVAHRLTGDTQFTPNKTNLLDAARWIQEKIRNATGIGTEKVPYTDENVEPLAELMATEAMRALEEDSNAIGWYDAQITAAKRLLDKIEPRIFESRTNESAFDWALAVTSNGQAVAENFGLALEVFRFYMNNGRFPVKEFKKGGDRNSSMRSSFSFFNQYQDMYQKGEVTTPVYDFLDSEFTVRDLQEVISDMNNEFGTDISVPTDELQDTVVFGSYLAGPKIGQGFYQNLRGNFEPLTMDIWWMRMWNRLVNRPFKPETPQSVINQKRTAFRKEIMEQAKLDPMMRIVLGLDEVTFPNKKQPFTGALKQTGLTLSDLRKNDTFDDFVPAFNRAWNRYYTSYKSAYGKAPVTKETKPQIYNDMSVLEDDIYGSLQATPANGTERNYMRQVTARARQLLQTQGIDINTADMQALLWYPEKRLFEALGVPKGQGQDTDYLEAAILQARKEGLTDAEIEETLADPRSGQVDTRTSAGESVPDTDQKDDSPTRLSRKGKPVSEIIELAKNNPEGFTFAIEGETPTSGFVVAPVKEAEIVTETGRITEEEVNNLLAYAIEIAKLSGRPAIVGGWRSEKDGRYYLDAVEVHDNISDALYTAEIAEQEAIFDLGELNEINTEQGLSELSASGLYNSGQRNLIRAGQKSVAKGFESFRNRRREELITDNGRQLKRADRGEGAGFTSGVPRLAYPEYEAQRGPQSGRNEFFGVHYSNVDGLDSLDANKHGTGKPGKELLRGWKPRVYFYVQEDENLPMPELKLEDLRHGYGAKLTNIHDPRKDTSITEAVKAEFGAFNIDAFEDAVEAAGYDGYINHSFQPGQGAKALVLTGQHNVPVVQTMINKKRVSEKAVDPSTKKLMYSKKGGAKGAFAPSQTYEDAISRLVYKDTTNPFTRLLGKVVGQVEGESLGQAFVRNTVNRFLPGFILDNIAYGAMANDSNSVGKAMELSQQMSGRMEALINLGALKIDPETGDVSMSDDPENKGIMEIFAPIGEEKKDAYQVYSLARREAKLRQKGRTGLKNLSNEYIQKIISEAPQEFRDVHNNYQKFNDLQIQFAVDSGLITEEMADNLRDMAYVPFYREMEADAVEDLGKAIGKNAGNSLNNPSVFDKKLEGGIIKMGDFYENIVRNNEMILSAALRNVAMRKTADALDRMNQLGITSHGKKLTKKSEGERVLVFRRDGEEQFYQIDDAALWVSIANLTPTQRNAITAFMEIFAGILRSGVTLSPGFMLANLWRGKIDAYVKMGVPLNPITTTIRGMKDAYSGGDASTSIKIRTGIGGYTYGIGQEAFANELRRKYRRKEGGYGPLQRFTDGLSEVKFQLEKVGEATEFAERVAVYDKLMAAGMSEREAAYQAMNLINFGRRGAGGGVLGSFVSALVPMIPFLNARIQGLYRLIEDPNQPQDIRLKMTKEVALRGALVGLGSTALYSLAMQDDRWDEERLDRKLNYDIIYVGDKTIYLPRAFEIGAIFGSLPMLTLETIRKEDGKDLAEGTASIFLNTFAFNPIPQGALPLIETAANFDFFRMQPIVGMSLQRAGAELQYYDSTPEVYKQFGQAFGVSPLKAQQIFEGYTGNMGAGLIGMFDSILGGAGIIPDRPAGVFGDPHSFLGTAASASGITRFIAEDGQRSSKFVTDFYEIKRGIEEVKYAINQAAIRGDQEEIDRLMEEQGVALQFRKQFNRVSNRLTDINNRMKIVSMSSSLSSQQKSDQLRELREEKNRLTKQMVQAANKVGLY